MALGLVAVLSIAGTLAYLQKQSGSKTNTFTGSAGLKLLLTETQWDYDNNETTLDDGSSSKEAAAYKPSTEYLKNPQLVNTASFDKLTITTDATHDHEITAVAADDTNKYDEYVAMRIDFKGTTKTTAVTYSDILSVIEPIQFDTTNWKLIKAYTTTWVDVSNSDITTDSDSSGSVEKNEIASNVLSAKSLIFAYKGDSAYRTLSKNTYTPALYSSVKTLATIPSTLGGNVSTDKDFPTFNLVMSGAAVDTASFTDVTDSTIETSLLDLLKTAP